MSRFSANKFYNRVAPIASSTSVGQGQGRQGITVRGRDHVGAVFQNITVTKVDGNDIATEFEKSAAVMSAVLDPTNVQLFPWMSKLAKLFQTFKINDLKFVYEPQCTSSQNGLLAMWYDPDPTNFQRYRAPLDMGDLTQRGVSVHGALWAKHMLSVPQSLCASRAEYYIKENYPPISIKEGQFRFDALEYFPGLYGVQYVDTETDFALAVDDWVAAKRRIGDTYKVTYGRVYVEYSVSFGKAESMNEAIQTAAPLSLQVSTVTAASMSSANHVLFRPASAAAIGTPCWLYGEGQVDTITNTSLGAHQYFSQNAATRELVADHDCDFTVAISLHGASGAWNAANALAIEIKPSNSSIYQRSIAGVLALSSGQRVNERYTAGLNTLVQMSLFAVSLKAGDSFRVYLANNGTITAWNATNPGYSMRFYACAYDADAAPF